MPSSSLPWSALQTLLASRTSAAESTRRMITELHSHESSSPEISTNGQGQQRPLNSLNVMFRHIPSHSCRLKIPAFGQRRWLEEVIKAEISRVMQSSFRMGTTSIVAASHRMSHSVETSSRSGRYVSSGTTRSIRSY